MFAQLPAANIDKAMQEARGVINILLEQFSFLTKTSIPDLQIVKAYDVTPEKKSGKFIQYSYGLPFNPVSLRQLDKVLLKRSSENILKMGEIDNGRVTRSMHWYRLAAKSTNALERFTCLWIALETINQSLCEYYGIETEYSTCECCDKNQPILSGVKKLFAESQDKNLTWRKVIKLRATTLHGSKQLHEIVSDLKKTIPSLQDVLFSGLCKIIDIEGSDDSILNIGSPDLACWISTATISGPNLGIVDEKIIPGFVLTLGTIYTPDKGRFDLSHHKPVIDDAFKFRNEEHTFSCQPDFARKFQFLEEGP